MTLKRDPNMSDPDGLYAAIVDSHADLSDADSSALNARLVLLLANHIGAPPSWPRPSPSRASRWASERWAPPQS